MTRSDFMKLLGLSGGALLGKGAAASTAVEAPGAENSVGVLTDLELCVGCRRCEWACNDAHGLPNGPLASLESVDASAPCRRTDAESFTVVNGFEREGGDGPVFVKSQCMHCVDPACVSACPVKAFQKTGDGPVVYDERLCIGCRYCMVACPFGIPAYEYDAPLTPRVRKCTLCAEERETGAAAPACVSICPQEALTFGKRDDLLALARKKIHDAPERYVNHVYGKEEAGGTSWLYVSPVPFSALGFPIGLSKRSYPELTKGFLSLVPLVHAIWPMLLVGLYTFGKRRRASVSEETVGEEQEVEL